jgi:hypothetical protein
MAAARRGGRLREPPANVPADPREDVTTDPACPRCGTPQQPGAACACAAPRETPRGLQELADYRYACVAAFGLSLAAWLVERSGPTAPELLLGGPWLSAPLRQPLALVAAASAVVLHLLGVRATQARGARLGFPPREVAILAAAPLLHLYGTAVLFVRTAAALGAGEAELRRARRASWALVATTVGAALVHSAAQLGVPDDALAAALWTASWVTSIAAMAARAWVLACVAGVASRALERRDVALPPAGAGSPPDGAGDGAAPLEAERAAAEPALPGAPCVSCGSAAPLRSDPSTGGQRCCACGGLLLERGAAASALERSAVAPEVVAGLVAEARGRPLPCAACGGAAQRILLKGRPVRACTGCGALWIEPPVRPTLPAPPAGAASPRGAAPARDPRSQRGRLAAAAAVAAAALVVAGVSVGRSLPAAAARRVHREAATVDPAAAIATAERDPPDLPDRVLLGGRSHAWWRARLVQLRAEDPAGELYRLTRERAEANGLVVEETASGLRVVASPALLEEAR